MPLLSLPNLLTLSRILAIPLVVASFYVSGDYARWFACALFSAAGFTDWLDGHVARRWQQQSELGRFLDPIADKLLVAATLFMLVAKGRLSTEWALLPALGILCREILVSGLREYLAVLRVGGHRRLDRRRRRPRPPAGDGDRRVVAMDRGAADAADRIRLSARRSNPYDPGAGTPPWQVAAPRLSASLRRGVLPLK